MRLSEVCREIMKGRLIGAANCSAGPARPVPYPGHPWHPGGSRSLRLGFLMRVASSAIHYSCVRTGVWSGPHPLSVVSCSPPLGQVVCSTNRDTVIILPPQALAIPPIKVLVLGTLAKYKQHFQLTVSTLDVQTCQKQLASSRSALSLTRVSC